MADPKPFASEAAKAEAIRKLQGYVQNSEAMSAKYEKVYHDHLEQLKVDRENLAKAEAAPIKADKTEECDCANCANGVKPKDDNPDTHCYFCECFLCIPGA